ELRDQLGLSKTEHGWIHRYTDVLGGQAERFLTKQELDRLEPFFAKLAGPIDERTFVEPLLGVVAPEGSRSMRARLWLERTPFGLKATAEGKRALIAVLLGDERRAEEDPPGIRLRRERPTFG